MMREAHVQEGSDLRDRGYGRQPAGFDDFWVEWQQSEDRWEGACTHESVDVQPSRFGSAEVGLGQVRCDPA